MATLKDVYWMASPLAIDQRNKFNGKLDGLHGKTANLAKPMKDYINPTNEVHVFRKVEHWTLEVDDICYEFVPDLKKKLNVIRKITDMIEPASTDATEWHENKRRQQIEPERRKVG